VNKIKNILNSPAHDLKPSIRKDDNYGKIHNNNVRSNNIDRLDEIVSLKSKVQIFYIQTL